MINDNNICLGCMENIINKSVCPNCGYIQGTENLSAYIQPKHILNDRYLIGKVIRFNGQSVNYIAYDKNNDKKVIIEEFFPENLVDRDKENFNVITKIDKFDLFNDLKNEFIDLIKSIAKIKNPNVVIYYDYFEENSTVYLIKEYICGISLSRFLVENAGAVNWEDIQDCFKDLIYTLINLNNENIIHKGISPENIILVKDDDKINLKLINFAVNDLRLKNSKIIPQLYTGYTAPEQYSSNNTFYNNTDVYSICAVLYKCLTGTTPVDAFSRSINDNMIEPKFLNNQIPNNISSAIIKGLAISPDNRTKDMRNLYDEIYGNQQDFTRIYNKDTVVIQPSKIDEEIIDDNKNENKPKSKNAMFKALIITLPILIIILILLWVFVFMGNGNEDKNQNNSSVLNSLSSSQDNSSSSVISSNSSENSSSSSSLSKEYQMPNLVGKSVDIVLNSEIYKEFLIIETEEIYSDQYENGIIIKQSINQDKLVPEGTKVIITVSKGTQYPVIPDYTDLTEAEYTKKLRELGIKYKIEYVKKLFFKDGMVCGIDKTLGSSIDISGNDVLIVEVVKNK